MTISRRLHVVGLPHTDTIRSTSWCAYTDKVRKFCDMMTSVGYEVILYANEHNDAACTEHVVILTDDEREGFFGNTVPAFNAESPGFNTFNVRAGQAVLDRAEPGDLLCIIGGRAQALVAAMNPALRCVEFGIGYSGVFADFLVFESYAWMHMIYGSRAGEPNSAAGRFYDAVIPNYFEADVLPFGKGNGGYHLFMGRLIDMKGWRIAVDITDKLGVPLHVAGQGTPETIDELTARDHVVYHGVVEPTERAKLYGGAAVTYAPTLYVEPFGGVAVESMLCGTPVISTDWGAFTETNIHGVTGWRCRTAGEFLAAAQHLDFDRRAIRKHAMRYSTTRVRHDYVKYFEQLATVDGDGWNDLSPGRIPVR